MEAKEKLCLLTEKEGGGDKATHHLGGLFQASGRRNQGDKIVRGEERTGEGEEKAENRKKVDSILIRHRGRGRFL